MRLALHPVTPESRLMAKVIEVFDKGGVVVYPTDSGYSVGCDAMNKAAVRKLYHLKRAMKKYVMALMMHDFSMLPDFAKVENATYRYMKKLVPGPYTFILPATVKGKKILDVNRPEIGIRMPDCSFCDALFKLRPNSILLTTAAKIREDENLGDPDAIEAAFGNEVDLLIDMGPAEIRPTTIISLVSGEPELVRQGVGVMP